MDLPSLKTAIRKTAAAALAAAGLGLTVAGIAQIYPPAAFIVGGVAIAAYGLFGIDVDVGGANRRGSAR